VDAARRPHAMAADAGVTPGLGKITECIPYVRQDQVSHIQ
jgi:hypothetical protein